MTYDAQGREMHSWRVLLLPFLADGTLDALYSSYHMDKPWDAPENLELSKVVPDVYVSEFGSQCERHAAHQLPCDYG